MTLNEQILRAIASGALLSATFGCQPATTEADPAPKLLDGANHGTKPLKVDVPLQDTPPPENPLPPPVPRPSSPALEASCLTEFTEEEMQTALAGKPVTHGQTMLTCKATCGELMSRRTASKRGYDLVCSPWEITNGCCHTQHRRSTSNRGRPFVVEGVARTGLLEETSAWASQLSLESSFTSEQRRVVADAWAQAGAEEHASIASFSQFLLDLMSLGAPPQLIQDTAKAINDEVLHAQACFGIASALAGNPVGPGPLDVSQPQVLRTPEDILRAAIREGCIGETLAAHLAGWLAPKAEHRTVRGVLEGIADDEGAHAALAWEFVAWMLASRPHLRTVALEEYEALQRSPSGPVAEAGELVAWGVATEAVEAQLFSRAVNEVLVPAFNALLA